jgi:small subunit ribosomal protein S20
MPHTKSAKKSLRQTKKRRLRNRLVKKGLKNQIKEMLGSAKTGTLEEAQKEYNLAAKKLDQAAAKRVIHPNLAARKKAQLAKLLNKKKAGGQAAPAATGS